MSDDKEPEADEELEDLDLADEEAVKVKGSITLKRGMTRNIEMA